MLGGEVRIGQIPLFLLSVTVFGIAFIFVISTPNQSGLTALLFLWGVVMVADGHYTAKAFETLQKKKDNVDLAVEWYREGIDRPIHNSEDNWFVRGLIQKVGSENALRLRLVGCLLVITYISFLTIYYNYSNLVMGILFVFVAVYGGFIVKQSWQIMNDTEEFNEFLRRKQ